MRTRRYHSIQVARYYQRLENIENRRKKAIEENLNKRGFFARLVEKLKK
mgnify:FL=1|jgi:hypothetical protein